LPDPRLTRRVQSDSEGLDRRSTIERHRPETEHPARGQVDVVGKCALEAWCHSDQPHVLAAVRLGMPTAPIARQRRRERHLLARREALDAVADRVDHARRLMTHDDAGLAQSRLARVPVQVGTADADACHLHAHLSGARVDERAFFDSDRARAVEDPDARSVSPRLAGSGHDTSVDESSGDLKYTCTF
jgi:hypothetical protein